MGVQCTRIFYRQPPLLKRSEIIKKLIVFAKENVTVSQKQNDRFIYSDDNFVRHGIIILVYNSATDETYRYLCFRNKIFWIFLNALQDAPVFTAYVYNSDWNITMICAQFFFITCAHCGKETVLKTSGTLQWEFVRMWSKTNKCYIYYALYRTLLFMGTDLIISCY